MITECECELLDNEYLEQGYTCFKCYEYEIGVSNDY
jgi:hypothetical protein